MGLRQQILQLWLLIGVLVWSRIEWPLVYLCSVGCLAGMFHASTDASLNTRLFDGMF